MAKTIVVVPKRKVLDSQQTEGTSVGMMDSLMEYINSIIENKINNLFLNTDSNILGHTSGTAVHGATGAVVGTTNSQSLTNKTLTQLKVTNATELTIATGVITVTQGYHTVDTEGDAASDDLVTISGGVAGQIVVLRAVNDARTVVVKNGGGNIVNGGDATLDNSSDTWVGIYNGSNWIELARSDNAP